MSEAQPKRNYTSVELDGELRAWILRKVAQRQIEDRPFGERSMGAVIRDLLKEQYEREKALVAA